MITLSQSSLPAPEAELRAALTEYQTELKEHADSVGAPAPWPQFEILRAIVSNGGEFIVTEEQTQPLSAAESQRVDLEQKRAAALRALEDKMLAEALADPAAPAEVKDYQAALATAQGAVRIG